MMSLFQKQDKERTNMLNIDKLDRRLKISVILAPTKTEYKTIVKQIPIYKEETFNHIDGIIFNNKGKTFFVCYSKVGKVNTAFILGLLEGAINIEAIYVIGAAGALDETLNQYDVVVCNKVCYWDVDLTAFDLPIGKLDDLPLYFKSDIKEIKENLDTSLYDFNVRFGNIISADKFATYKNITKEFLNNFDKPLCVEMELASAAQCAHLLKIPFYGIKRVSDQIKTDHDNKDQYEFNSEKASENSVKVLFDIINLNYKNNKLI